MQRTRTRRSIGASILLVALTWAASACEHETGTVREGDACLRTSQCQLLLACIEGVCSRDLSSVAEQSTVPDLVPDAGAALDAAAMSDGG